MKINNNITNYNYPINKANHYSTVTSKGISKTALSKAAFTATSVCVAGNITAFATNSFQVLLLSLLGSVGALFLTEKIPSVQEEPIQLNPTIEFKKAERIEDAANFAKNNFKIKSYKVDDLEVANWINEGLTELSNRFKGKVYMPKNIKYKALSRQADGRYHSFTDTLTINKMDEDAIDSYLALSLNIVKDLSLDETPLGRKHKQFVEECKNYKNLSKIEKLKLSYSITRCAEVLLKLSSIIPDMESFSRLSEYDIFGPVYSGRHSLLFHEMGHVFDNKSGRMNNKRLAELKLELNKLILPKYTGSKTNEFVADIFAGIMNGDKYPDEIMDIFKKACNIKLPED